MLQNIICSHPVEYKLGFVGNPDDVVLHGMGEEPGGREGGRKGGREERRKEGRKEGRKEEEKKRSI